MGFFDSLTNLTPEQNQGLLGLAQGMLAVSGPSRMPVGFGQVLGAGLQGYQQATADAQLRKRQEEHAAQLALINQLRIRDAQADYDNQETQRKRANDLRDFYKNDAANGSGSSITPPISALVQQTGSAAPTTDNAEVLANITRMQGPQAQVSAAQRAYQQRLAQSERLRAAGFGPEADALEDRALKFQPKVKGWEKVQQDGKVLFAPYFEDGTSGQPVPLEVAQQLEKVNVGGSTELVNPFTGQAVRSLRNTQSPDSAASVAATIRGQNMTDARAREANALKALEGKAPTEFQGKSAAFGLRATEADKILRNLEGQGVRNTGILRSIAQGAGEMVPFIGDRVGPAVGSAFNALPGVLGGPNEQQQQTEQARRDFVNAVLRQESGAVIGPAEFENATRQYFPQPGDTEAVIAQKARNRQLAIQGLQSNAGRARMTAPSALPSGWSVTEAP